ncbi:MAG: DUF4365 domain-containing protein [Thermodesulfobacteriota bacterium]
MTTPIQSIEESMSVSLVSAIVSRAGATYDIVNHDYGVDLTVRRVDSIDGKRMDMGGIFDCQLKATINLGVDENHVIYDLDADVYNKLLYRRNNSTIPCFLVVMCLPKDIKEWICVSEESLTIKKCCYYFSVSGEPTKNTSTVRVKIPREQLLTPSTIKNLITKVSSGDLS